MKRRYTFLLLALVCAGLLSASTLARHKRPLFQGRTIHHWAQLLLAEPTKYRELVPRIGPSLIPHFLREIEEYRPSMTDSDYKLNLYLLVPERWRGHLILPTPPAERRLNAIILLGDFGPAAKTAVPELLPLLEDEAVSTSVLFTLGMIGPDARQAIPKLLEMLEDPDGPEPFVAGTLVKLGVKREDLEPVLQRLNQRDEARRGEARRRRGVNPHDGEDLVQGFFARLIEKSTLDGLERSGGRFRSFLLVSFNHFVSDERDRASRFKRGGGQEVLSLDAGKAEERYDLEPTDLLDPEKLFERRWALTVLERVLDRLKVELESDGQAALFARLQNLIVGERGEVRQAQIGAELGLTEGAIAVTVHRLRRRYRRLLQEEIASTVADPFEVEAELRHLLTVLRR